MSAYIALTGKELLRKWVFLIIFILSLLFIGSYSYGLSAIAKPVHSNPDDLVHSYVAGMALLFLGLYFAQMISSFFVIFSSMGAVTGEIDSGILYAVLARPVSRRRIFMGKWLGLAVWNLLFSAVLFWAVVMAANHFLAFPMNAAALSKAFLLFEWIPLLLLSVSMLGATYLPMLGNGVLCALLYGMSMFGGLVERVVNPGVSHQGIEYFGIVTSLIMPTDSIFRRLTYELMGGVDLTLGSDINDKLGPFSNAVLPSASFLVFSVFYLVIVLIWGASHFIRKDIS